MEKLIITVAITGSRNTRMQTPFIPVLPEEIARSGLEAQEAGASVLHIHARDPKTGLGTQDQSIFEEIVGCIRAKTDAIICLTTSGIPGRNLPIEERFQSLSLKPDMVSFDAGSMNMGEIFFHNPPAFLEALAEKTKTLNIKPELEIFDVGWIDTCRRYLERGLLKAPLHFQLLLGAPGGSPANVKSLLYFSEIIPSGSTWSVGAVGAAQLPMAMVGIVMGGHVRVGLEDNIYYSRGVLAKNNAELVERVVRIAKELGREIAAPQESRKLLSLP